MYEAWKVGVSFVSVLLRGPHLGHGQGWQGRNGGADLRPAPRAPDRNPRPAPRAPVRPLVTATKPLSPGPARPGTRITTAGSTASPIV